jgi:hypothetical protein
MWVFGCLPTLVIAKDVQIAAVGRPNPEAPLTIPGPSAPRAADLSIERKTKKILQFTD